MAYNVIFCHASKLSNDWNIRLILMPPTKATEPVPLSSSHWVKDDLFIPDCKGILLPFSDIREDVHQGIVFLLSVRIALDPLVMKGLEYGGKTLLLLRI